MPLMKLACTALERVPLTRRKVIDNLMKKFHQDLVFCRSPADSELTIGVHQKQKEKIDPILEWVDTEFGFKPVVYTSFFGGKQDEGLAKAVETVLKKATDSAHSLVIPLAIFRERLGIEEAIELIRLEEDHQVSEFTQVDRWGLVEGGHDVDIADLKVQMSSAVVFLGLSRGL
ncbi:ATP12 ATPase [Zea mays]|uniref:ATP12 ATPase n=1 Tax=Zea mays TaxID=4577 RepID=A0A1D6IL50_MAIZE|nr:ATP12 ATPase [Zea mays]ONM60131.1 ATP12 ATPase [Zea mays]